MSLFVGMCTDTYGNVQEERLLPGRERLRLEAHSLDPIVILVSFLFPRSPLGVSPVRHVAINTHNDHEDDEQQYELLHSDILCYCFLDPLLAQNDRCRSPLHSEVRDGRHKSERANKTIPKITLP